MLVGYVASGHADSKRTALQQSLKEGRGQLNREGGIVMGGGICMSKSLGMCQQGAWTR